MDPMVGATREVLQDRAGIIVLREDLDFYVLPPKAEIEPAEMLEVKRAAGRALLEQEGIFSGLRKSEESGTTEQHLIEMLTAGYNVYFFLLLLSLLLFSLSLYFFLLLLSLLLFSLSLSLSLSFNSFHRLTFFSFVNVNDNGMEMMGRWTPNDSNPSSGFNHDDHWGHRAGEPNKAVICSLALARLRTDIRGDDLITNGTTTTTTTNNTTTTTTTTTTNNTNNAAAAVGMAQKLLLFWRKPARRCWWEGTELVQVDGVEGGRLKVWIRRVWTLEMVCFLGGWGGGGGGWNFLHPSSPSSSSSSSFLSFFLFFILTPKFPSHHLLWEI